MPVITGGGSLVSSESIVNGSIVNEDINEAAAIALTKLANLIGNPGSLISIETTAGTTHSLTTLANQRVLVFGRGDMTASGGGTGSLVLAYNGVTKDTASWQADSDNTPQGLMCMYTEVPGAGTQNVTISGSNAGIGNGKIIVIKLQESA